MMTSLAYHHFFGFGLDPRLRPPYCPAEVSLRRGDYFRGNPSKELPSRVNRQRRSAERRELKQALHQDIGGQQTTSTTPSTSTKCAATQTIISTVRQETNKFVGIPSVNPAFPVSSSSNLYHHIPVSPPQAIHPFVLEMRQCHRPTVINVAPSSPKERQPDCHQPPLNRKNGLMYSGTDAALAKMVEKPPEVCDEIEEHFRRSLGENYPEEKKTGEPPTSPPITLLTPPSSATLPRMSPPLVVAESVDDHFAKALGEKWNLIKTDLEPPHTTASPPNTPSPAALTSQVFKHASFVSS